MPHIQSFHDVRFPAGIALGASGGPVRRTEIVALGSGHEQRNARWARSRRRYDAGFGIRTLDDLHEVVAFFEARSGRLFAFRFRDPLDHKSCAPGANVSPLDQLIGTGNGTTAAFQLVKAIPGSAQATPRNIVKPVAGSVRVAVDGVERAPATAFTVDHATGLVTFTPGHLPAAGAMITAGFEFDLPARFDTDEIRVSLVAFEAGEIPSIPLVEVLA
jgi:uncharacterized protein (TIGR02217 family)